MLTNDQTEKIGNVQVRFIQDEYPEDPRGMFNHAGHMVCLHGKYKLGDSHGYKESDAECWDGLAALICSEMGAAVWLPLYLYDHSGITMNPTGFSCGWDSGQVGIIYIDEKTLKDDFDGDEEKARACLVAEVKEYDEYLTGNVWGREIHGPSGELLDSCWGYYGHDYIQEEAMSEAKWWNENLGPLYAGAHI